MIDIHCHLLPDLDDGPDSWEQSLAMARMAAKDGTQTIIATPHQLGQYRSNRATIIRDRVTQLQERLEAAQVPLTVLAGADVRIEPDLAGQLQADEVLTLADQGRHVLLELPHELFFPLDPLLSQLKSIGMTGILSHPERNLGIQSDSSSLGAWVDSGCLMQITASSLLGGFGRKSQQLAEAMLQQGLVHFVASDGHATDRRRPHLSAAYSRVQELTDSTTANNLFQRFPALVCAGQGVPVTQTKAHRPPRRWFALTRGS